MTLGHPSYVIGFFDLKKDKHVRVLRYHSAKVNSIIWNLTDTKEYKIIKGHEDAVNTVAFSPFGIFEASGSEDTTARL